MKIVFLGTPIFAAHILEELKKEGRHEIAAVVTQPDRPRDRNITTESPVKELAAKHNIKVLQYDKISKEGAGDLKALNADIFITAAYGQILSKEIIDIPPKGIINVHASLLPNYRGAAPIQWAVIKGEKETGVSIMKTEAGLDSGPTLLTKKTVIGEKETAGELFKRLQDLGAEALKGALDMIERGNARYVNQDEGKATFFPPLRKTDGEIDWGKSAREVVNLIRGVNPWPGAYTYFNDSVLKIWSAEAIGNAQCTIHNAQFEELGSNPGRVISSGKDGVFVECGEGIVKLLEIQCAGGKRMPATEFIKGRPILAGTVFCKQL